MKTRLGEIDQRTQGFHSCTGRFPLVLGLDASDIHTEYSKLRMNPREFIFVSLLDAFIFCACSVVKSPKSEEIESESSSFSATGSTSLGWCSAIKKILLRKSSGEILAAQAAPDGIDLVNICPRVIIGPEGVCQVSVFTRCAGGTTGGSP